MTHPQKHIDYLEDQASNHELVRLLSPDRAPRLRNESRATAIRDRIATLTARLAKLKRDHPEK